MKSFLATICDDGWLLYSNMEFSFGLLYLATRLVIRDMLYIFYAVMLKENVVFLYSEI